MASSPDRRLGCWRVWVWTLLVGLSATAAQAEPLPPAALRLLQAWTPPPGVTSEVEKSGEPTVLRLAAQGRTLRVLIARSPQGKAPAGATVLPSLMWMSDPRQPEPRWAVTLAALGAHLQEADRGQFAAKVETRMPEPPPVLLMAVGWLLLLLSLPALWRSLARAHGELIEWLGPGVFATGLALALLPRIALPHRLVMVHFGFLHVDQAVTLTELPRYGPATTLLDHALFALAPAGHVSVQWLHVALGVLTLWPLAALAGRLAGPVAAGAAWLLLALAPWSWLDHGSESMLVPAMLWWSCGVVLLDDSRLSWPAAAHGRLLDAAAAAVLFGLCGLARPDCLAVSLPAAALVVAALPGQRPAWRHALIWLSFLLVLWAPDVAFLRDRAAEDLARGNLPRLQEGLLHDLPRRLLGGWLVLDPRWFPLPVAVLAFAGVALAGLARRVGLILVASLVWALPMFLDFNDTSKLRLHAPSALLLTLAAAVTVAALWPRLRRPWQRALLVGLAVVPGLATAPLVLAPQLSDATEAAVAAAAKLARDGRPTALVVRTYDDEPALGVHMFWPGYALEAGDRWLSVRDWQAGHLRRGEGALAVVDVRCWAHLPSQQAQLGPLGLHPACASLKSLGQRERWGQDVANVGERGFSWYAPAEQLPVLRQQVLELPELPQMPR